MNIGQKGHGQVSSATTHPLSVSPSKENHTAATLPTKVANYTHHALVWGKCPYDSHGNGSCSSLLLRTGWAQGGSGGIRVSIGLHFQSVKINHRDVVGGG